MSVNIASSASEIKNDANEISRNEYRPTSQKEGDIIYDLSNPQKIDIEKAPLPQNENTERNILKKDFFEKILSNNKIKIGLIIFLFIFGIFFFSKIFSGNDNFKVKDIKKEKKNFVDFDIYEVFQYNDTKEKITEIKLNKLYLKNSNENDISHSEKFNVKYFINIYDIDDLYNMKILIGILNDKQTYFNKAKDNLPIMILEFNPLIGIINFNVPEKINITIASNLYYFACKIFLNKDSFLKKAEIIGKNEYYSINEKKNSEDNYEKITTITKIENNRVKEIIDEKFSNYYSNKLNFDEDKTIFSNETKLDENNLRKIPIESYSTKIKSKIILASNKTDIQISHNTYNIINQIKFIKYDNNKKYNNRNLQEEKNLIDNKILNNISLTDPIIFNYALFRTNLLGVKISLNAKTTFNPKIGLIGVSVSFNSNGEETSIMNETIFSNFNDIYKILNQLTKDVSNLIEKNIIKPINSIYSDFSNDMNKEINSLNDKFKKFPKFSNQFKDIFKDIDEQIQKSTHNIFNQVSKNSDSIIKELNQISESIKENKENDYNDLINISNKAFDEFFKYQFEEIDKIYEESKTFFSKVIESIEYQKKNSFHGINFDITTYYDIKKTLKELIYTFESFKERINEAISFENDSYVSFINEEFETEINPFLEKINLIGDFIKNNISIIETYEKTERDNLINKINSIKISINTILKNIINGLLESNKKNMEKHLNEISDKLNSEYNEIKENITKLNDILKNLTSFDSNFEIYLNDNKKIRSIEQETFETRRQSYQKMIDKIKQKQTIYLTKDDIITFRKLINNYINRIINSNSDGEEIINNLNEKINNFINQRLGESFLKKIVEDYTKENFLKSLFEDYYNSVNIAYDKYKTDFFETFKLNANKYVSRPTEMENKLIKIKFNIKDEENNQIENFNLLIISLINEKMENAYQKIYNILLNGYNNLKNDIKDNPNSEKINEKFQSILHKFIDQKGKINPTYTFKRKKKDQFSLSKYISDNESKILSIITNIIDEIKNNFNKYFCNYNTDTNCTFQTNLSALDQYNYQIAKLRDSISNIMDIIPMSKKLFDDSIFNTFKSDIFSQLFPNKTNNDGIYKLLNRINRKIRKDNFNDIEKKIESTFVNDVNLYNYLKDAEKVSSDISSIINIINNEGKNYLISLNGPLSKIINIFNEELNYIKSKDFNLKSEYYKKSYDEIYKKIFQNYYNIKNSIIKQLAIPSETISKHLSYIIENLKKSKENLLHNVLSTVDTKKCNLLSKSLSLSSFTNETLNKYFSKLENEIYNKISSIYNKEFSKLNDSFIGNIDKNFEEIIKTFETEYNETFNRISKLSKKNSNNEIIEMKQETKNELEKVFNKYFENVEFIYSKQNIFEKIGKIQDKEFKSYEFNFTDFADLISKDFNNLTSKCESIKENEKNEFIKEFPNSISEVFNFTSNNANVQENMNYINKIFTEVYLTNFSPKFKNCIQIINDNYDFMNSLLDSAETKSVSVQLSKRILNMFPNLKEQLNNIVDSKLNLMNMKMDSLKYKINYKVLNNMMNLFSIKNEFSSEIYDLIEKSFTEDFKEKISKLSNEIIEMGLIKNLKDSFNELIQKDLSEINELIDKDNRYISKAISLKSQTRMDSSMISIRHFYDNFDKVLKNYVMLMEYNLNDEKKNKTNALFKNTFKVLDNFDSSYNNLKNEEVTKVMGVLNNLNLEQISSIVKKNVEGNDLNKIVSGGESNIIKLINNLSNDIKKIFDKLLKEINDKVNNFKFEKFKILSSENKVENTTVNLTELKYKVSLLEKQFNNFLNSTFNSTSWNSLLNGENNLIMSLRDIANNINNYFKSSKSVLKDFISQEYIDEKTNNKLTPVLDLINNYLEDNTLKLSNNLYNIQLKMANLGNIIQKDYINTINSNIKNGIIKIFNNTVSLKSDEIIGKSLSDQSKEINIYNEENEIISTLKLKLKKINSKYGYSLGKGKENNFKVNVHISGNVDLKMDYIIGGFYKNIIEGKIGSGEIGINPNYYFYDEYNEIDAYVKQDKGEYNNILQQYNFEKKKWEDKEKYEYNIPKQDEIHINKIVKIN